MEQSEEQTHQTTSEAPQPLSSPEGMYSFLCNKDDISWQQLLYQAVKAEQMDPWNIDIGNLAQRFLQDLQKMKELDFKISGKMILAAAILLRLKSTKLVNEDVSYLDQLLASTEQNEEQAFYDELTALNTDGSGARVTVDGKEFQLLPRTPQPRKRKVSVYDLVEALEKALEVKQRRRIFGDNEIHMEIPQKKVDIEELVAKIFKEVTDHFLLRKQTGLTFQQLLKEGTKHEKVYTFLPLLHLSHSGKLELDQKEHLGEIHIRLGPAAHAPQKEAKA